VEPFIKAKKSYTKEPDINLFKKHTHDNYEIFCFLSGDAKYFVEGNIYDLKPNDILIIKKSEVHVLLMNKTVPYLRCVINFNEAALLEAQRKALISLIDEKPLGKRNRISSDDFDKSIWLRYIDSIVNADSLEKKRLYLTVLLTELIENINKADDENHSATREERLIEYINRNLMSVSSLDEICERFYISKTHLNRIFKAMTGSTVWDYIVIKRLIAARDLLRNGWKPNAVSEKCGYLEYSSFYRAYRSRFGVSPKDDYCG